jgi:pimeloyl-ACP methyl ester carboxylesterase
MAHCLHGAGSTGATARWLVEPLVRAACEGPFALDAPDDRTGDVTMMAAATRAWCAATAGSSAARIVSGISLGAHAVASALADLPPQDEPSVAVLIAPAWTGDPDGTAAATAQSARGIAESGSPAMLNHLGHSTAGARQWIVDRLRVDWSTYGDGELVHALDRAAVSSAPDVPDLSRITVPTLVIAFADDPLHPIEIARTWARAIPGAVLATCRLGDVESEGLAFPEAVAFLRTTLDQHRPGSPFV